MLLRIESYEVSLVGKIRVLYFLEDRAQEGFIKSLVKKVAKEESIPDGYLYHDIRSARGGSRIINEFRKFLSNIEKMDISELDIILIVSLDGNCKGYNERVKQLDKYIKEDNPFKNKVIYAIPDPHIERWYLMDQKALKSGIGLVKVPKLPPYKCKKSYYKQLLNNTLKESNVTSLLSGAEYAERIVDCIEKLEVLSRQDVGFKIFIKDLRRMFRKS